MIYPFFILWGPWFWLLLVIDFAILIWAVEDESPGYCISLIIILFAALWLMGDFNVFEWIKENPKVFFVRLGLYIPVGIVYAVIKYTLKLTDKRRKVNRIIVEFLDENKVKSEDNLTVVQKGELLQKLRYEEHPTFAQSTRRVIFWMAYWPWSAFWTLLNNPLRWLYEEIYERMVGSFKRIYNKILGSQATKIEGWKKEHEDEKYNSKDPKVNQYRDNDPDFR